MRGVASAGPVDRHESLPRAYLPRLPTGRGSRVTGTAELFGAVVERGWAEILTDLSTLPRREWPGSFAELHDRVDANEYGGLCEATGPVADLCPADLLDLANRAQDEWSRRLLRAVMCPRCGAPVGICPHLHDGTDYP